MQRHSAEPVPSWDNFLQKYQHLIPALPQFSLQPLSAKRLRAVLNKMSSHSAAGLDNWEVRTLKALPDQLLDALCVLYDTIESTGIWPTPLTAGYLCLIPKPDSDGSPASLRPLSILSVVYRLWASTRLQELMIWQESWAHSAQSGFRSGLDCADSWHPLALKVEQALLNGHDLAGCFLDFEKALNLLPLHEIILPLAVRMGLPQPFVACLSNLYSRPLRVFKHAKGFGSAVSSDRGIVQGCPISVVLLNLLVAVFMRLVDRNLPSVKPRAYADDISCSSSQVHAVSQFLNLAGSFATVTRQPEACQV